MDNGETALATSGDPFLFDHDSKVCKKKKAAHDIVQCLLADPSTYQFRNWSPVRVRVHSDATFASWQRDAKRDVIARHRKELGKLADHAFVHFDSSANDVTWEIVLAV